MFQQWFSLRSAQRLVVLHAQIPTVHPWFAAQGDTKALRFTERVINHFADRTSADAGFVVQSDATSLLMLFEQAEQALQVACALQQELTPWGQPLEARAKPTIGIGLSAGAVLCRPPTYAGETLRRAAALAAAARGGQVLLDDAFKARLPLHLTREVRPATSSLPGKTRFAWRYACQQRPEHAAAPTLRLHLQSPDGCTNLALAPDRPIRIGRDARADFVVCGPSASREHAVITWRHGYYMLTDTSLHGTWVRYGPGGAMIRLRRNVCLLEHQGALNFGRAPDANKAADLLFTVGPVPVLSDPEGEGMA